MRHLQAGPSETTFDVESLIRFGAVQNALVAANLLSNVVERLNYAQSEFLTLLVLCDGNVLDVTHKA